MSPRKATKQQGESEYEAWRAGLLVASLSLLFLLAPIVYRLTTKLVEEDYGSALNTNVFGVLMTLLFGSTFLLMSSNYVKQFSQQVMHSYQNQLGSSSNEQRPAFLLKLFPIFASTFPSTNHSNSDKATSFYSSNNQDHTNQDSSSRRKIDSKYFKPKFIIHELITFWDTTCTVVTWGSFYVIGGTIVATEKITQRIKSKSSGPRSSSSSSLFGDNNRNSSRGTGQSDFSFSSAFGATAAQCNTSSSEPHTSRRPFKRISSWTKRSINSVKKKYSRAVRSNAPQITSGSANESSSSIFFFGSSPQAA